MSTLPIGTIFHVPDTIKNSFWKITGPPVKGYLSSSLYYPTVKCSLKGKEFRLTNGFEVKFVETKCEILGVVPVGEKADIDSGVKSGARKRRIQYLENKIAEYQKELENLLKLA